MPARFLGFLRTSSRFSRGQPAQPRICDRCVFSKVFVCRCWPDHHRLVILTTVQPARQQHRLPDRRTVRFIDSASAPFLTQNSVVFCNGAASAVPDERGCSGWPFRGARAFTRQVLWIFVNLFPVHSFHPRSDLHAFPAKLVADAIHCAQSLAPALFLLSLQ